MFTGIVEAVGRVDALTALEGGRRLRLTAPFSSELSVDESVAVNGACLTVVAQDAEAFEAVAVEETLKKTSLGDLAEGDSVNLERALRLGGRLDGHLVQGHVDATGTVEAVEALADSWLVRVRYPASFAPYLIPVGSVALDGISLTVARLDDEALTVAIIPHTWDHTTVQDWRPGRRVNLEFDLVGKYVVRALAHGIGRPEGAPVVKAGPPGGLKRL
ncbi:MAG: riboflavin synthase [Rubricoccaceae bacterium]|nr:riboflavin synthase [Rubricoccaceae bacterium]